MPLSSEQLIESALRQKMIQVDVLNQLRLDARRNHLDVLDMVCAHYRLPLSSIYRAAAEARGLVFVEYAQMQTVDTDALKSIPQALAKRKGYLPITLPDSRLLLATLDPDDRATIETVRRAVGKPFELGLAEPAALNTMLNRSYQANSTTTAGVPASPEGEVDLVSLLERIFKEAYLRRSSDIHILQDEFGLRTRLRVDGKLQEYVIEGAHNADVANGLISRIKVLANLDIAEQREPQDGGMSYYLPPPIDSEFNVRVATVPTRLGERVTMRILGQDAQDLTLAKIGMSEHDLLMFKKAIRKPFGMILLTGPTGSGKSTTLFAALREINTPDINIMTVENPVEYVMEGVSQIQTSNKVTFAGALRSLLRHDPDVMMVGEIRDEETADTALKAAMTGHLVFSTLHTNTAVGCISRLADIGCEPFLIGSTMNAVIAQRLVRRLCEHCKAEYSASDAEKALLDLPLDQTVTLYKPVGCAMCQGVGYRRRLGLFETLWFDDELSKLVSKGCSEEELETQAGERLRPMWADGVGKVLAGITTLAEVENVAVKRDV